MAAKGALVGLSVNLSELYETEDRDYALVVTETVIRAVELHNEQVQQTR